MSRSDLEFLWYLPNTVEPGHRLDTGTVDDGYGTLDYQVDLARRVEDHGWAGRCSAPAGAGRTRSPWPRPSRPAPRRSTR